jgi:LemA protein
MIATVILVIALAIGLTLLAYAIGIYNRLIFLKNQCDKSWFNIDVILKQRHDEIPKLIGVCEGSMKFERETLEKVIAARTAAFGASGAGVAERARLEGELSGALGRLFAVAEQYPELKTTAMFAQLQVRISSLENELSDRREFYNDSVMNNNVAIESVPSNFVASFAGMRTKELFKVSAADQQDVEVKFKQP